MIDGTCAKCHKTVSTYKVNSHLNNCTLGDKTGTKHRSFILRIEDLDVQRYWMYLKMSETATLDDLDKFLRNVWLECCGHLSEFNINGRRYERQSEFTEDSLDTKIQAKKILENGLMFSYTYDFGSSTNLQITVHGEYHDNTKPKNKVEILMRNNQVEEKCKLCGKKAELICAECYYDEAIYLCKSCEEPHGGHVVSGIVNSPRMGVCGYE